MRHLLIGLALAASATTTAAHAQIGNPAGMIAGTQFSEPGVPAPGQPNNTDRLFARLMTAGGLAEVALGELTLERTESDAVREFADRMVADHGTANETLAVLAADAGIPLPDEPTPDQQAMREALEAETGTEYDLIYLRDQIIEHQKAVQLLQWEIGQGQEGALQRFAADTLPSVLEHLSVARQLQAELNGTDEAGR